MDAKAIAAVAAVLALVSVIASAGTTGQLVGTVVDDAGTPLPGSTVGASSPSQIGAVQTATTGADGSFRFPRLAPGYYTVLVELVGFAPQQLKEVQVRLDRVTSVHVVLPQASFAGQIEVAEMTPVVDLVQVSTGQTFTTEYITEKSANWSTLITQTAGASNDNFRRVMGSTPQDGGYLLDGMDSTNWYQRFPNPAALALPFDVIQEVAVHSAGFEAEFGQATGAVVNVSTKSGGNRFSGTVDIRYTGSNFETAGEHYDPDEQESEDARFAATLGGPILRDRLWFFVSYGRDDERTTPTGAPTTRKFQADIYFGKLTWQPSSSWSVVARHSYRPYTTENRFSSPFVAPEATSIWRDTPSITSAEAVAVVSPEALWGLRAGRRKWFESALPADGDLTTIGHFNLMTGEWYGNWPDQYWGPMEEREVSTDLSWLLDGAGSHELKAGLTFGEIWVSESYCYNGSGESCAAGVEGFFFRDLADAENAPIPYIMTAARAEGPLEYGGKIYAGFLQDSWRLSRNVTLKMGLRWDRVTYDNETGEIADLSKTQPRVGVAWDVGGNGKTAVRASWGRFMHPGTAILAALTNQTSQPTEFWLSCSTLLSADPEECAALAEAFGLGYRSDQENWDPAGWFLDPGNVFFTEPAQTADNLRAGYADEWIIGFEREISRRTSVELTYVNKSSKDGFDDTCNGNVPEPNPDAACDFYLVANLPDIRWDYEGLILRFESRALDNLHLLASWVISESKGSIDANTGATASFDVYPYHFVNRYGHLADHSRHRVKLNGYWLLPYDFSIAFDGWWDSEFRWTPLDRAVPGMPYGAVFVEPRGSGKGGNRHQLDLQFSKGFRVGPTRLVLLATVFNATNSENENEICGNVTGCGEYDFGAAIEWQIPRRYEVGFRVEF
jgi:hypothetical protein